MSEQRQGHARAGDFDKQWEPIRQGLDQIMREPQSLDQKLYISLYEEIHSFCVAGPVGPTTERARRSQGLYESANLYNRLDGYLKGRAAATRTAVRDLAGDDDALLRFYADEWSRYSEATRLNSRIFMFLSRHYIKRENDENNHSVFEIIPLHMKRWKEGILDPVQDNEVVAALLRVVERSQGAKEVDLEQAVKTTVTSLMTLDVTLDENIKSRLVDFVV